MIETEVSAKITQIMRLVHWIQTTAFNYTSNLIYDSANDIYVVNIKNKDQDVIYRNKIESFGKKSDLIKTKELEKMANALIELKQDIELKNSLNT